MRIKSRDGRKYLGIVTAGPFAEPDSLRADSPLARHRDGARRRLPAALPRPRAGLDPGRGAGRTARWSRRGCGRCPTARSFALTTRRRPQSSTPPATFAWARVVGHRNVVVNVPSDKKAVLPRHLAVLGTTGGGKSTTVARLIAAGPGRGHGRDPARRGRRVHPPARADRRREDAGRPGGARPDGGRRAGGPDDAVPPRRPRHHEPGIIRSGARSRCSSPACRLMPSWRSST